MIIIIAFFAFLALTIFGGLTGYATWQISQELKAIYKFLSGTNIKKKDESVGVTMGSLKPVEEPKSTATVITPKTPQQIEDENREELRKQGYNV